MAKYTGHLMVGDIFINTSTFRPAHCGIVSTDITRLTKKTMIIHATNGGIVETETEAWTDQADVFRGAPPPNADEKGNLRNIATEIMASAKYGMCRAGFKSTFSTHTVGSGALTRLEKYRERLENHQGVVKNVYCSELVILCYQLAWIENKAINQAHRLFIDLDGKHTWPSTLRSWLKKSPNFAYLGTHGG